MASEEPCVDLRQQVNRSVDAGVQAYNWIPKAWTDAKAPPPMLDDNTPLDPDYPKMEFPNRPCETHPGEDIPLHVPERKAHGMAKAPHPDSDFSHTDPEVLDQAESSLSPADYAKLKKIIGESFGMQRLACLFEWVLTHTHKLLGDINDSLGLRDGKNTHHDFERYQRARQAYIEFLRDLDIHEPRAREHPVVPGVPGKSGYGQTIKWAYICPLIHAHQIKGAKVVLMWNPHSSSNGIPIEHIV